MAALSPPVRKFLLLCHIVASVGWIGLVLGYLILATMILTSGDPDLVRGAVLTMDALVRLVIVPFALLSLLTGLASSLGSAWGLFRHYWVIFKLVLNLLSLTILVLYVGSISSSAEIAGNSPFTAADLDGLRNPTHLVHSAGATLALLAATVLAVYKPKGVTGFGHRKQQSERAARRADHSSGARA